MLARKAATTERFTFQSASRPATQVPITEPTPKASRKPGMLPRDRPVTSVTTGAT